MAPPYIPRFQNLWELWHIGDPRWVQDGLGLRVCNVFRASVPVIVMVAACGTGIL